MTKDDTSSMKLRHQIKKEAPIAFHFSDVKREVKEEEIDAFFEYGSVSGVSDISLPPVRKRGVKFKPKRDEKTNRRRALNKEAALRYREKRRENVVKFRMYYQHLEKKNRELKEKERKLLKEVAVYEKLVKLKKL